MSKPGLAKKVDAIEASAAFVVAARAKELAKMGREIVDLSLGEPDFGVPAPVKEGLIEAIQHDHSHYTDTQGVLELRKELAAHLGHGVEADQIMICSGCKLAIFLALETIIDPGDEVIMLEPAWVSYKHMTTMIGGKSVSIQTDAKKNFVPDLNAIKDAISDKTKAIILNSPCNPSGRIIPKEVLEKIVELAKEHEIFIIADEIYSDIVFEQDTFYSMLNFDYERIIVISGFSKNFAMTGLRVGYLVAKKEITKAINKLHGHVGSCAPSICQYGVLGKLADVFGKEVEEMRKTYEERRDFLVEGLKETIFPFIIPQGTFYILLDISKLGMKSLEASSYLLEEFGVAMVPGIAFGEAADDFVRISFATSNEQLSKAIDALKKVKVESISLTK